MERFVRWEGKVKKNDNISLIIIILLVSAAVYGYFNLAKPPATPVSTKSESISLTDSQAVDKVKSLKEVRDYLTKVPGGL